MRNQLQIILCVVAVATLAAATARDRLSGQERVIDFSGKWVTEWGLMTLELDGSHATGTYEYQNGAIDGTASGNRLEGMWFESTAAQSGSLRFEMSEDLQSWSGHYTYAGDADWVGPWSGERVEPESAEHYSGVWKTEWGSLTLTQEGDRVTGVYPGLNGRIEGTVTNGVLDGQWYQNPIERRGFFVFILARDGLHWTGNWRFEASEGWDGEWNGQRVQPEPDSALAR